MVFNPFSDADRQDLIYRACVAAVAEGFPHLSVAHIIEPPLAWFDAALARQVVLHLMAARFDVPKRRISLLRSREATYRGIKTVDNRLYNPTFEEHYRRIAARAEALLVDLIQKEAAA